MSEESVSSQAETEELVREEEWEGQEAMGERLVREAKADSPVVALPLDDRILLFPVVPDETRPVDLTVLQLHGQDLPEMGVVVAVGWKVNAEAVNELRKIEGRKSLSDLDRAIRDSIISAELISVGNIVLFNKFSGMDVQGTNFVVCSKADVLTKLLRFPVRIRQDQERWDQVDRDRRAAIEDDAKPRLAVPGKPDIEVASR